MAQYGMNPFSFSTKFKVGRLTGNQAFSTWSRNQTAKYLKNAKKSMWKAAAWCRTDMRRGFSRRNKPVEGYNGYWWASNPPAKAGRPPRRNAKGKAGLQYVTFAKETDYRFRIGSDMFPAEGYGDKTNFHGDVMHNTGGYGMVMLPEDLVDIPDVQLHAALSGQIPWPMRPKLCHYPKRNYLETPKKKVMKQFKHLFSDLEQDKSKLLQS